jgi:hypothetical protein
MANSWVSKIGNKNLDELAKEIALKFVEKVLF